MAFVRVRHASLFISGRKYAEAYMTEEDVSSGDEPQYGDEGLVGMSDGAATTNLSCEAIVPVLGSSVDILKSYLLKKLDIDITYGLVNGQLHQYTVRCTNANFKGDAKAGTLVGSFKFIGKAPNPV